MGEIEVRRALKKLGHLVAAEIATMPAGSYGTEIIVCPPHEIALSVQPLDRGPWAFPVEKAKEEAILTPAEESILAACSKTIAKKAIRIAREAKLEDNSYFRDLLTKMVRSGLLTRAPEKAGYLLA